MHPINCKKKSTTNMNKIKLTEEKTHNKYLHLQMLNIKYIQQQKMYMQKYHLIVVW